MQRSVTGLSGGLTVPFALTAGLSGIESLRIVVLGGPAEPIVGAISMGVGVSVSRLSLARGHHHPSSTIHFALPSTSPFSRL